MQGAHRPYCPACASIGVKFLEAFRPMKVEVGLSAGFWWYTVSYGQVGR